MPLKYQGGENIMIELFKLAQHDLLLKKTIDVIEKNAENTSVKCTAQWEIIFAVMDSDLNLSFG